MEELDRHIRDIPDFPSPGIMFKDITPMLQTPEAFQLAIDEIDRRFHETHYDHVVGIESRGFIFGAALAYKAKASLALVRKPGKLPYKTDAVSYDLGCFRYRLYFGNRYCPTLGTRNLRTCSRLWNLQQLPAALTGKGNIGTWVSHACDTLNGLPVSVFVCCGLAVESPSS